MSYTVSTRGHNLFEVNQITFLVVTYLLDLKQYLAFFPSPACAFFNFLLTIGILDVANREVVDREAMDRVRAGTMGAGIVG